MQHYRHTAARGQRSPARTTVRRPATVNLDSLKDEDRYDEFKQGQAIFKEGDVAAMMYVVLEGTVRLSAKGREIESVNTGGVLGEMALFENGPRSMTATAATDCKLAPVDLERFTSLVQQIPHFSLQIMRAAVDRLRRMDRKP